MKNLLLVYPRDNISYGIKPNAISLLSGIARAKGWNIKFLDAGKYIHEFTAKTDYNISYAKIKIFKPLPPEEQEKITFSPDEMSLKDIVKETIKDFKPDLAVFSVLYPYERIAEIITLELKKYLPDIGILWGGAQVTVNPQDCLNRQAQWCNIGEGMISFQEFLDAYPDPEKIKKIENIAYKDEKGSYRIPEKIPYIDFDIDTLPFLDYSIYDDNFHFMRPYEGKIYRGGDYFLSIGCPNQCAYCSIKYTNSIYSSRPRIRRFSVPRIISELKALKENYDLEFLKFSDENFMLAPVETIREFSVRYSEEIGLPFTTATHPNTISREKIKLMKDAGCASLSIAIEAGDEEYRRKVLKRSDTLKKIFNAFHLCREFNIRTMAFNIIGTPYYTREIYEKTIEVNRKANPNTSFISLFVPLDKIELYDVSLKEGLIKEDWKDSIELDYAERPHINLPNFTMDEIVQMKNVFIFYVKLPECFKKYILRAEIKDDIGIEIFNKLADIFDKTVNNDNFNYTCLKEDEILFIRELDLIIGDAE